MSLSLKKLAAIIMAVALMFTMVNITALAASPTLTFKTTNTIASKTGVFEGDTFKLGLVTNGVTKFGTIKAVFTFDSSVIVPTNAGGTSEFTTWDAGIRAHAIDESKFMEMPASLTISGNVGKLIYTIGPKLGTQQSVDVNDPNTVLEFYFKAKKVGDMNLVFDPTSSTYYGNTADKVGTAVTFSFTNDANLQVKEEAKAPVASGVKIAKINDLVAADPIVIRDGDKIEAGYTFTDANTGDVDSGSTFAWYLEGTKIDGQTSKTITIVPAYVGKNLEFEVTPKSNNLDDPASVAVKSSAVLVKAKAGYQPKATASITGTAKVNDRNGLTVNWELDKTYDGVTIDESTVAWYIVDTASAEVSGDPVSTANTFKIDNKDYVGKFAKAVITLKAKVVEENFDGAEVVTAVSEAIEKAAKSGGNNPIGGATLPPVGGSTPAPTSPAPTTQPPTTPPATGIEKFKDVPKANYGWAVDAIDALAKDGIIKGITEDKFEPETKTTKAQLVAMIMRALNLVDDSATTTLVKADYWGFKEIASAKKLGVLDFYGDKFDADSVISREDMATVIAGAAKAAKITIPSKATAENFKDASSISSYAADAIKALQQAGIINGMGDGTFAPKGETTRAQAAKVIDAVRKLK